MEIRPEAVFRCTTLLGPCRRARTAAAAATRRFRMRFGTNVVRPVAASNGRTLRLRSELPSCAMARCSCRSELARPCKGAGTLSEGSWSPARMPNRPSNVKSWRKQDYTCGRSSSRARLLERTGVGPRSTCSSSVKSMGIPKRRTTAWNSVGSNLTPCRRSSGRTKLRWSRAYKGRLPCLRLGGSWRFSTRVSSARMSTGRVSWGSITSSMYPLRAAT